MLCNEEGLQMYLDGELDKEARKTMEAHLSQCSSCRREMSRLQLLWLELGQTDDADLPPEWPYLRQQVIHQTIMGRHNSEGSPAGYWEAQKLAWQPALLGASYLPGLGLLSTAGRAAGRQIPSLMSDTAALALRLIFPPRDKKGGSR